MKLQSILKHQFKTTDINRIEQYGVQPGRQLDLSEESNLTLKYLHWRGAYLCWSLQPESLGKRAYNPE